MTDSVKAYGFKEIAEFFGVLRGGAAENSIPSVELKNLTGGVIQRTVKVYNPDPYKAKDDAVAIFKQLEELFG